jgi:hypothetical protein
MMLPHAACIKLWNNNPLEPPIVVIYEMFLVKLTSEKKEISGSLIS